MFAKTIIDSDAFLDMPLSTQCLYFHLSMRADDDGFLNNCKKIQRTIGASDDDLRLLMMKKFIIPFENGIVVIKHWKIHNYIQSDRYKPTVYQEEKSQLVLKRNRAYSLCSDELHEPDRAKLPESVVEQSVDAICIQNGYSLEAQDRLGKDRLGKVSLEIEDRSSSLRSEDLAASESAATPQTERPAPIPYHEIADLYNGACPKMPKCTVLSDARKKAIRARYSFGYKLDDFRRLFTLAGQSAFLNGGNKRNFMANFDWLIRDTNMAKVLSGNYTDRPGQGCAAEAPKRKSWAEVAAEMDAEEGTQ
jgi:hypothetical protein